MHVVLWLVMRYSLLIIRVIKDGGVVLVTRLAGMMLSAIAVQQIINGITQVIQGKGWASSSGKAEPEVHQGPRGWCRPLGVGGVASAYDDCTAGAESDEALILFDKEPFSTKNCNGSRQKWKPIFTRVSKVYWIRRSGWAGTMSLKLTLATSVKKQ